MSDDANKATDDAQKSAQPEPTKTEPKSDPAPKKTLEYDVQTTKKPDDGKPPWLDDRLARERESERKKLLSELGIDDPEAAKLALQAAREAEEASKSEIQKLTEKAAKLEGQAQRAEAYERVISQRATLEMELLTETQKAAVKKIAGDDAAAQLNAIDSLKPTWSPAPAATTNTDEETSDKSNGNGKPPADTAPPRDAPGDNTSSPPDHKARYEDLKKTNPVQAAWYLNQHLHDIYPRT